VAKGEIENMAKKRGASRTVNRKPDQKKPGRGRKGDPDREKNRGGGGSQRNRRPHYPQGNGRVEPGGNRGVSNEGTSLLVRAAQIGSEKKGKDQNDLEP